MLDSWSSYTVTIVWEIAWADSELVALDKLSSCRGCLSRLNVHQFGIKFTKKAWLGIKKSLKKFCLDLLSKVSVKKVLIALELGKNTVYTK